MTAPDDLWTRASEPNSSRTIRWPGRSLDVVLRLRQHLEMGSPLTISVVSRDDAELFGETVTVGRRCLAIPDECPYELAGREIHPCWSVSDAARTAVRLLGKRAIQAALDRASRKEPHP